LLRDMVLHYYWTRG